MRRLHRFSLPAVIAVVLCCSTPMHAQEREGQQMKTLPQAELDVVKVLLAQERAWNKGDLVEFATGYKNAPQTIFMGTEVYRGYDEMLGRYRKNYPDRATMGILTFSDLEPRILDDHYAIATGHFSLERDRKHGGPASGIFSLVLEKTAEGWKIILDHTT